MTPGEMRALRRKTKWTQQMLADAIGMRRETVGAMERGQALIEKRTALAVLYVLSRYA